MTGTSKADYDALRATQMTETQLQAVITANAERRGYLTYHTHDSRRSQPGFPDLVLVHEGRGIILFRELKTGTGRLRPEQKTWLTALVAAGQDAAVWRPLDWFDGTIDKQLDRTS